MLMNKKHNGFCALKHNRFCAGSNSHLRQCAVVAQLQVHGAADAQPTSPRLPESDDVYLLLLVQQLARAGGSGKILGG